MQRFVEMVDFFHSIYGHDENHLLFVDMLFFEEVSEFSLHLPLLFSIFFVFVACFDEIDVKDDFSCCVLCDGLVWVPCCVDFVQVDQCEPCCLACNGIHVGFHLVCC